MRWRTFPDWCKFVTDIAHHIVRDARCSRGILTAMKDHSVMSQFGLERATTSPAKSRRSVSRENLLLAVLLYGVVRGTQALAGDQLSVGDFAAQLDFKNLQPRIDVAPTGFAAPLDLSASQFSARPLTDVEVFSETEFGRRRRVVLNTDSGKSASIIDAPMTRDNSIWQHMAEYKSEDRLRLLTLWQMRGSSLSVQAGKRGAPSLQWSTPWVRRESASRGLFDHLLVISPRVLEGGTRNYAARPSPGVLGASKSLDATASPNTR
jgi:hypothetical protein